MKKIIYLLLALGLVFTGCNPNEDINSDIDAQGSEILGSTEYTLTDDDYDDLDLGFGSFNSVDQAKDSVPQLLAEKYPYWGQGSSVLVNYNLFIGSAEGLSDYTGANTYEFSEEDYANQLAGETVALYPGVDAGGIIPEILADNIEMPEEGQIVLANYEQYYEIPEGESINYYEAVFPSDFSGFEIVSVAGPDELGWSEDTDYIVGNGFDGAPNLVEEWIISPQIDLTEGSDLFIVLTQEIDFLGDEDLIDVLVSTDYTEGGDVADATWTALDFDKTGFGDMSASENIDFSDYDGEQVHVALKYSSTDSDASRWRVESISINEGVPIETNSIGEFYEYSGSAWEPSEGVYSLNSADYDSMGEGSGQPGRFDNFSSSTPADDYLPTFLDLKYPFALEEDEIFVVYKYFSSNSGLGTRGDFYTVINGEWIGYESTIESSLQFGYDKGEWIPDNTIRYTLGGSDYQAVVAALADVAGFEDVVDNLDSFGNFNRTDGNWTDDQIVTALNVVLDNLDPSAEELQKYVLTIATWAPGNSTEDWEMIKYEGEWITQELYAELTE